jgi:hypothetical protein
MKLSVNKILGLAVGERSILVAEVSAADGRRTVTRAGEFVYPAGVSFVNPEALGTALGTWLRSEGFSARAAIFGIPAKWVLTKSKELPPVDPSFAADMLRLQVESEFSAEIKDLVYDYAGQTNASQATHVLLAATPRKHVDQLTGVAEAARLTIRGIAPTSVVLGAATAGVGDALVLSITPSGTELAAQRGTSPSLLRHIGSSQSVTASVAGEVRRASLMMPRNGSTTGNGATNGHAHGQVVVWDDAGLDHAARRAVTDALGPSARTGDFNMLGVGDLPEGIPAYAASVSLAVAGMSEGGLAVDFQHSRLAPPKKSVLPRQAVLGIAAGAAVVLGLLFMYIDLSRMQSQHDALIAWVDSSKHTVDLAKPEITKMKFAEGWHTGKPRYLACWADLQNAVPDPTRPPIFLYSLTLDDNMKGDIRGRARSKDEAEAFVRKLNKNPRFVNMSTDRDKGNNNPDTKAEFPFSFTINFTYRPG